MTAAGIQKQTLTDAVSHAILEEPQHLNWDNFLGVLLKVQRTANTFEIPENVSSCPCHGAWRVRLTYPRVFIFFSELSADQRVYSLPTRVIQFRRARAVIPAHQVGIDWANLRTSICRD